MLTSVVPVTPLFVIIQPDNFASFGELLKILRRRAGLTWRELSIPVGYSTSQISRLELNQRPPDGASLAAGACRILGVCVRPVFPDPAKGIDPCLQFLKRLGLQLANPLLSDRPHVNDAGGAKNAQMFRYLRLA